MVVKRLLKMPLIKELNRVRFEIKWRKENLDKEKCEKEISLIRIFLF